MADKDILLVVYDPPSPGLPYLSAIFIPGVEDPVVTPFATAAQAEAFNKASAAKLLRENK
jgi:hypothetical protein